jgi:hypothetical protein
LDYGADVGQGNSEQYKGAVAFFGALVGVVLAAELGLHVLEDRLPEPVDWYAVQAQELIAEAGSCIGHGSVRVRRRGCGCHN